jgi:hypothetical protein
MTPHSLVAVFLLDLSFCSMHGFDMQIEELE